MRHATLVLLLLLTGCAVVAKPQKAEHIIPMIPRELAIQRQSYLIELGQTFDWAEPVINFDGYAIPDAEVECKETWNAGPFKNNYFARADSTGVFKMATRGGELGFLDVVCNSKVAYSVFYRFKIINAEAMREYRNVAELK